MTKSKYAYLDMQLIIMKIYTSTLQQNIIEQIL